MVAVRHIARGSASYRGGQVFTFTGTGTDPEDGNLPPSAFTWRVDFITSINTGSPVVRPFLSSFSGATSGSFTPATEGPYTLTDVEEDQYYYDVILSSGRGEQAKVIGMRDFVTPAGSVRLDGEDQVNFILQMARDEMS